MRLKGHGHAQQEAQMLKLALVVLAYRIFGHVLRRLARQQEKGMRPNLQLRVAKCAGEERHVEIPVSNGMTSVTWDAAAPAMVE